MFTGKEQRALEFHFPFFLSILSFLEKKLPVFPFFFFFFSCSSSFSNFGYTLVLLILKCYKYGGLKQWVYDFEIFALQGLRVYIFTSRRSMLDKLSQQVVQEELNHLRVIWSIYEVIIEGHIIKGHMNCVTLGQEQPWKPNFANMQLLRSCYFRD